MLILFHKEKFSQFILVVFLILGISISTQSLLAAWLSPTNTPPNDNTDKPLTQGSSNENKSGNLSIDGNFAVTGTSSILGNVGIGKINPNAKLQVMGNINATDGYVQAYASDSSSYGLLNYAGYGGYFYGTGGVFSQNTQGYYAYLGYPNSSYGLLTNGSIYASGGVYDNGNRVYSAANPPPAAASYSSGMLGGTCVWTGSVWNPIWPAIGCQYNYNNTCNIAFCAPGWSLASGLGSMYANNGGAEFCIKD